MFLHQLRLRSGGHSCVGAAGHRAPLQRLRERLGLHKPGAHLPPSEKVPAAARLEEEPHQVLEASDAPLGR